MHKNLRVLAAALTLSSAATAQTVVGITETDSMFTFQAGAPGTISNKMPIMGLQSGQTIVGTDYRPATRELFALGYNSTSSAAQLYTLNTTTGMLTAVGTGFSAALGTGSIGFDFNPTVDRIRLVGANRNNYRLNPITGGIAAQDGALMYAATDPNVLSLPSIGAAAYTNSFPLLSGTDLYYYDESLNNLVRSSNPNAGTLNTVGSSGITVNTSNRTTDMDISFNPMTRQNTAYFVANTSGTTADNLYTINLSSGATIVMGSIGLAVKDISVQPMPFSAATSGSRIIHALAGTRSLISFAATAPRQILSLTTITGVDSMYTLVGMDFRPANGELFALGYAGGDTSRRYRLYRIDPATGAAMMMNTGMMDTLALGNTREIGFDFNPTVDRIRVVSGLNGANYRLNPTNGAIAATDSNLMWTSGDANSAQSVRVSTVAYTNSYPNATATVLNGINDSGAVFIRIDPPNNGRLNTVVNRIYGTTTTVAMPGDLDYFYDSTTQANIGYLAANTNGMAQDVLYTVTTAGVVTAVDTIGYGFPVSDLAVMPQFRNANPVAVTTVAQATGMRVFPNPADRTLQLELSEAATMATHWMISDLMGRAMLKGVLTAGNRQSDVSLQSLAPGVYLLNVEGQAPIRFSKL
ncbi:MAG: DUF4394 domain-containing protein [Sphingobacteriales bacterium]|nr:MAG: DUF4394 domain-containing protein [Sphingobacteriales bacterium]